MPRRLFDLQLLFVHTFHSTSVKQIRTSLVTTVKPPLLNTMSTGALLDQDFGSESEDDNFNPAPADESDNEVAGESDPHTRPSTQSGTDRRKSRQFEPDDVKEEDDDEEENKDSASVLDESKPFRGPGLDDGDESENVNGRGGDEDNEDEEDLEEEDDEEDVVSVGLVFDTYGIPFAKAFL